MNISYKNALAITELMGVADSEGLLSVYDMADVMMFIEKEYPTIKQTYAYLPWPSTEGT